MAQQLTRGAVGGADTTSAVESNPTVALLAHLRAALAALADAAVRGQGDRTAQRRSTEVVAVVLVERVADLGPVAAAAAIVAAAEDACRWVWVAGRVLSKRPAVARRQPATHEGRQSGRATG